MAASSWGLLMKKAVFTFSGFMATSSSEGSMSRRNCSCGTAFPGSSSWPNCVRKVGEAVKQIATQNRITL